MGEDIEKEHLGNNRAGGEKASDVDRYQFPSAFPSLLTDFLGNVSGLILRDVNIGVSDLRGMIYEKDCPTHRVGVFGQNTEFDAVCRANGTAARKPLRTRERMLELLGLPSDLRTSSNVFTHDQWESRLQPDVDRLHIDIESAMKDFGIFLKPFGAILGGFDNMDKVQQAARERRSELVQEIDNRRKATRTDRDASEEPLISSTQYSESIRRTVDSEGNSVVQRTTTENGKSTTTVTKTLSDGTTETSQTTVDTPPTPLNTSLTLDHLAGLSADLWQIPTRLRPRVAEAWPLQTPEESTELQSKAIVGENRATERAYEQDSMHEAQGVDSMRAMAAKGFFGGLGAPFGPSLGEIFGELEDLGRLESNRNAIETPSDSRFASSLVMESQHSAIEADGSRVVETTRNENGRRTTTVEHTHPDGRLEVITIVDGEAGPQSSDMGCHGNGSKVSNDSMEDIEETNSRDGGAKTKNRMSVSWSW